MDDVYTLYLIGGADEEQAQFVLTEVGNDCRVECNFRGRRVEAGATDFFEAFCRVRMELAKEGLIPFCYGASLNVYPSAMARDMGGGLKAYKMVLGEHARISDLVEIFSEGADIIPAYVEPQKAFFEEWLATPKPPYTG